jgi:hypothetical protein
MPRFITVKDGRVSGTRIGTSAMPGEIMSDIGEPGQMMQPGGSFLNPEKPAAGPTQLDRIETMLTEILSIVKVV